MNKRKPWKQRILDKIVVIVLIPFGLTACNLVGFSNAWQATKKAKINSIAGPEKLDKIEAEITTLLSAFKDTPVAQLLISQPTGNPPKAIYSADIEPYYGTFTESDPDLFNFKPDNIIGPRTIISTIEYLNGINIKFRFFDRNTSFDNDGQLGTISILISSNNRNIDTPIASEVTANLNLATKSVFDTAINLDTYFYFLYGNILFTDSAGIYRNYNWDHLYSQLYENLATDSTQWEITKSLFRLWSDQLNNSQSDDFSWLWSVVKRSFVPTEIPGRWVLSKYDRRYEDNHLYVAIPIEVYNDDVNAIGSDGHVSFVTDPSALVFENFVADVSYFDGSERISVAKFKGGPLHCDLNDPTSVATGLEFYYQWADFTKTKDIAFNCSDSILFLNTL